MKIYKEMMDFFISQAVHWSMGKTELEPIWGKIIFEMIIYA